jgi:predicted ArsR family transcriptional regulator
MTPFKPAPPDADEVQQALISHLQESDGPRTCRELADLLEIHVDICDQNLRRLQRAGAVECDGFPGSIAEKLFWLSSSRIRGRERR